MKVVFALVSLFFLVSTIAEARLYRRNYNKGLRDYRRIPRISYSASEPSHFSTFPERKDSYQHRPRVAINTTIETDFDKLRLKVAALDCELSVQGNIQLNEIRNPDGSDRSPVEQNRDRLLVTTADKIADNLRALTSEGLIPSDLYIGIGPNSIGRDYRIVRSSYPEPGDPNKAILINAENPPSLEEMRIFFRENLTSGERFVRRRSDQSLRLKRLECDAILPARIPQGIVKLYPTTDAEFQHATTAIQRLAAKGYVIRPPIKQIQVKQDQTGAVFTNDFKQGLFISPTVTEQELLPFFQPRSY